MDALRNVHRMVVPGGLLLDLHPWSWAHVEKDGAVLGRLEEVEFIELDLPAVEPAVELVVAEGLFAPLAERRFDVLEHFDSREELLEDKGEHVTDELRAAIERAEPPLVVRHPLLFRSFQRL